MKTWCPRPPEGRMFPRQRVAISLGFAIVALVSACGHDDGSGDRANESLASGPSAPVLLTAPAGDGSFTAVVEGVLGLSQLGCITLDGRLLLAPYGSRVVDNSGSLDLASYGRFKIGDRVVGGSGGVGKFNRT